MGTNLYFWTIEQTVGTSNLLPQLTPTQDIARKYKEFLYHGVVIDIDNVIERSFIRTSSITATLTDVPIPVLWRNFNGLWPRLAILYLETNGLKELFLRCFRQQCSAAKINQTDNSFAAFYVEKEFPIDDLTFITNYFYNKWMYLHNPWISEYGYKGGFNFFGSTARLHEHQTQFLNWVYRLRLIDLIRLLDSTR